MKPEDIARTFPEAVTIARQFRDVFGPGVRLVYARNQRGEELGRETTPKRWTPYRVQRSSSRGHKPVNHLQGNRQSESEQG